MEMAAFSRQITAHNSAWRGKKVMCELKFTFYCLCLKKIIRKKRFKCEQGGRLKGEHYTEAGKNLGLNMLRHLFQSIPRKMLVWDARISLQWGGRCAVSFKQRVALYPIIGMDIIPDVCEVPVTAAWEKLEVLQLPGICVCVCERETVHDQNTIFLLLPTVCS